MKNLLKNWKVQQSWTGKVILTGEVYNDEKKRWVDGTWITTSEIYESDFENKTVQTRNTLYNLE